jgi:hypothetical protein
MIVQLLKLMDADPLLYSCAPVYLLLDDPLTKFARSCIFLACDDIAVVASQFSWRQEFKSTKFLVKIRPLAPLVSCDAIDRTPWIRLPINASPAASS